MNWRSLTPLVLATTPALAGLLYDPASGQVPDAYTPNPWSYGQIVLSGSASRTVTGGLLQFDTTSGSLRSGWSSTGGTMDHTSGYALSFGLQVVSETHASNDRAGFSVIALSSDLQGVELGFWGTEVWAQNVGFTHGEGTSGFNPSSALISYELTIQGSSYTLAANSTPILTGSLRDYSTAGFPYTTPNFVFIGDNTFSAAANSAVGAITFSAVPEPNMATVMSGLGAIGFAALRRWKQARAA